MDTIKPILDTVVYSFIQEGNCNGTTQSDEELSITLESSHGSLDENSGFYTVRTSGWSVDNKEQWLELFSKIQQIKY